MQKFKILYVIDKLDIGGTQRHILELLKKIDRKRFEPCLCCLLYGGELIEEVKALDIPVLVLNIKRIYDFSGIVGLFKLIRFVREEQIDIVHTFLFGANILGNLAAKLAGAPFIISGRRDTGIHREGRWRHRQAYRFAHRLADRVFTVSNSVSDVVHRYEGVEPDRIITIYNGIDVCKSQGHSIKSQSHKVIKSQVKKSLGIKENEFVVGMIANISWVKGHRNFIEAARLILEEIPNVKFLIIGDGPLLKSHKSQVTSHKLKDKILFLGKRQDVGELLSIMDVSVNASYSEGMSNTILESMALEVPVVASNVDGNRELVVDNQTGFLVQVEDIYTMKEKIAFLLRNKEIAGQMGQNARRIIEKKFNLSEMVNRYENAYINLLNEKYDGHYRN